MVPDLPYTVEVQFTAAVRAGGTMGQEGQTVEENEFDGYCTEVRDAGVSESSSAQ